MGTLLCQAALIKHSWSSDGSNIKNNNLGFSKLKFIFKVGKPLYFHIKTKSMLKVNDDNNVAKLNNSKPGSG